MPSFKDLDSLLAHIQSKVTETLKDDVAEDASTKLKNRYQDEVYSYNYNSAYRGRRMSLVNDANIKKEMISNDTVSISSTAKPGASVFGTAIGDEEGLLAQWIEDGSIPNVFDDRSDYPWTKARPVVKHTEEEIGRSNSHIEAMKRGLKKRGINTV